MHIPKIGHYFPRETVLNLLPHLRVDRGYLRCRIDWISHDQLTEFNSTEFNTDRDNLDIMVGSDVHSITVLLHRHNSFPSNTPIYYHYTIRIDHLILLNLAVKLLKKS